MADASATRPFEKVRAWARRLKQDVLVLWIAARSRRTPLFAKLVAGAVAAYALSPIDLIPDFIPVLGYLDDLMLVPLGIYVALRMIPPDLLSVFRTRAAVMADRPRSRWGALVIVATWLLAAVIGAALVARLL